jgi:hypothetical protein
VPSANLPHFFIDAKNRCQQFFILRQLVLLDLIREVSYYHRLMEMEALGIQFHQSLCKFVHSLHRICSHPETHPENPNRIHQAAKLAWNEMT